MSIAVDVPGDEEIDPSTLTPEELREEIEARTEVIERITTVIDGNDRNHGYMDRAYRRGIIIERRQAVQERRKLQALLPRSQPVAIWPPPAKPTAQQLEVVRVQQEAIRAKQATKVEVARIHAQSDLDEARMFVRAVRESVPREQFIALWEAARAMFPEYPWRRPKSVRVTEEDK